MRKWIGKMIVGMIDRGFSIEGIQEFFSNENIADIEIVDDIDTYLDSKGIGFLDIYQHLVEYPSLTESECLKDLIGMEINVYDGYYIIGKEL